MRKASITMKLNQVAAQLYTLRDHLKTPADIAASLKKVRAIGYEAVQLSGLGPIDDAEILKLCRDQGLTICATHEPGAVILDDPQAVVAKLQRLGCRHTAFPHPGKMPIETLDDIKSLAAKLDAAGKVLADAGLTLSYHNHHVEFRRVAGKSLLEHLYALTNPRYLQAELDTYWVQVGGGEPTDWCRRMKGRMPCLHMKDYVVAPDNKVAMAEIGNGNLNWPSIIAAAEEAGCQWFIVEQDICPADPFDSLKQSFEYVKAKLCK
jgi:sugar phosphate isomerase/epimerase